MVLEKKRAILLTDNDCKQIEGLARGTVTNVRPVTNSPVIQIHDRSGASLPTICSEFKMAVLFCVPRA